MTTSIQLVEFSTSMADELVLMWRRSFEYANQLVDPHPIDEQKRFLLDNIASENTMLVAKLDEATMVGFVAANATHVDQLYVHTDYLRRGIGTQMLNWAKEQSTGSLTLFTFERNVNAQRFYEENGFTEIARGFEDFWQLPDIKYAWKRSNEVDAGCRRRRQL